MEAPSDTVRLTVPIPADLSRELAVLAFASDLTRGQVVRRALAQWVQEAKTRHAALAGLSIDDWWASVVINWEQTMLLAEQGAEDRARALKRYPYEP